MPRTLVALVFFTLSFFSALSLAQMAQTDSVMERRTIAREMRQALDHEMGRWYPRALDATCGGFFSDINEHWEVEGKQHKMIVTQARHIWAAANAAAFYEKDNTLRRIAAHGVEFLRSTMWDNQHGGFWTLVDRCGEPIQESGRFIKRADGHAYAIYALATYYRVSGDTAALSLARQTFRWLEMHSYDPTYGGYFQSIAENGIAFEEGVDGSPPKDASSCMHLLEGLTELFRVWPDAVLRQRLSSLLRIMQERMIAEKGYLNPSFHRDWRPAFSPVSTADVRAENITSGLISFGHCFEAAYLMIEAAEALGLKNDSTTLQAAKTLVNYALENGWDHQHGGFLDAAHDVSDATKPLLVRGTKQWWIQAEALNALLLLSELFPTDGHRYFERFRAQWEYCKRYVIDNERGGWYWGGTDAAPENVHSPKASLWKANYHTSRALINCINALKRTTVMEGLRRYEPVNPNATHEAKAVLDYLYTVQGKKIISGYMNFIQTADEDARRVEELTGKLPALWGCDLIDYYRSAGNADSIIQEAYAKHKAGYLITLMWHQGRPKDDPPYDWKESIQGKLSDAEWQELTTPGTLLHRRWLEEVDRIAEILMKLKRLRVPVLWRPYHESNGVWFWWGNRKGGNGSAKLFRMMFERYVNDHHLDNLLWVWNANAPRQLIDDEAYAYGDYFPGLDCVDVLAADIYHNDYRQIHHDRLLELSQGKPIAMGEIGEAPSATILSQQPMWTWFMMWYRSVDIHNTPEQIKELYNNPRVISHEEAVRRKE